MNGPGKSVILPFNKYERWKNIVEQHRNDKINIAGEDFETKGGEVSSGIHTSNGSEEEQTIDSPVQQVDSSASTTKDSIDVHADNNNNNNNPFAPGITDPPPPGIPRNKTLTKNKSSGLRKKWISF